MRPKEILAIQEHRPWPIPNRPWIMKQAWNQLLFAHWQVDADELQRLIPAALTLDTYEGQAWISVAPFWVTGARPRYFPSVPLVSRFLETNVRTYVAADDKPGVLFFSLDASNPLVVAAARIGYKLPYIYAQMKGQREGDQFLYDVQRGQATFHADYQPTSTDFIAQNGTLNHWLVERYCLYTTNAAGKLFRGDIHHHPWRLQSATAEIQLHGFAPVSLSNTPTLLQYAEQQDTLVWPLVRVV